MLAEKDLIKNPAIIPSKQTNSENILHAITTISNKLLESNAWRSTADEVLTILSANIDISRTYIFKNISDDSSRLFIVQQCYEWAASNIEPQIDNLELQNFSLHEAGFSRWEQCLSNNELIYGNVSTFPTTERTILEQQEIQSIAIAPIFVDKKCWGFIGFDECRYEREWSSNEINFLQSVATIFSLTIEAEKTRNSLKENAKRFEIIARATNDALYDLNLITDQVWRSQGAEILFGYSNDEITHNINWWKNNIHPHDKPKILSDINKLISTGRSFWSSEYRFRYGNGAYAYVFDRAYIIYDEHSKPVRMIGSMQDITEQKHNELYLRDSRERLRNLATRLQAVREEERAMLSRELHDEFAQILTALKLDLNWMGNKLPEDLTLLRERTVAMSGIIDMTMDRVRQIATELRPALLDDLGLSAAIDWQINQFYDRTGCNCNSDIDLRNLNLSHDLQLATFRIFQEALANIARHTKADKIHIKLKKENKDLILEVKDNGTGIPSEKVYDMHSLGLTGMRGRAGVFGGRVHIKALEEGGTSVLLQIPITTL